ncbi:MAG TPA: ABC transporter permease [Bryobacteraceae bacterium]|nr:ABC transporter permease [Bryobacteraceae bacterium]
MINDIRHAIRVLVKNPGFTAVAVLALALGIGANTAIFSVVNAVLLRPLAYDHPEQLVLIWQHLVKSPQVGKLAASAPDYIDYRDQNRTLQAVAGFSGGNFNLTGPGTPERINGFRVSANLFSALGASPVFGRTFTPDEDQPGRNREIVLSYGTWKNRFGGAPEIVGKTAQLDGAAYNIIGVMPKGFEFPPSGFMGFAPSEFWTPLALTKAQLDDRGDNFNVFMLGRVRESAPAAQVAADLKDVAHRITLSYPPEYQGPMSLTASAQALQEATTGDVRTSLFVILAAVGFVLLIGCANVANLLLAKAAGRRREIAIRTAIGAARWRVLRQLLTESLVLALTGGALGVLIAAWTTEVLIRFGPATVPRLAQAQLDWQVLSFTFVVSIVTGVLFGIVPALQASKTDLGHALREGSRGASAGLRRNAVRNALVVAEVALALMLLAGAGLLLRSFLNLRGVAKGFRPKHVFSAALTLPIAKYPTDSSIKSFQDELLRRVGALPGVQDASLSTGLPLRAAWNITVTPEGDAASRKAFKQAGFHAVTAGYQRTLGIDLKKGRFFTAADREKTLPVAVVNEAMARAYWPGQDALGKRFKWGTEDDNERPWLAIVGIVADVKQEALSATAEPMAYLPYPQMPKTSIEANGRTMLLAVRTAGEPSAVTSSIRQAVNSLDAELPLYAIRDMVAVVDRSVAPQRFNMQLLAAFAALAVLLAALGIYGVMSYSVSQYTQEIGIRMALGAVAGDVVRMILRQGMTLVLAGIAVGLAGALAITRVMASLLFGVKPADPVTFAGVSVLLAGAALLATWLPARRATRVDPIEALRYE